MFLVVKNIFQEHEVVVCIRSAEACAALLLFT